MNGFDVCRSPDDVEAAEPGELTGASGQSAGSRLLWATSLAPFLLLGLFWASVFFLYRPDVLTGVNPALSETESRAVLPGMALAGSLVVSVFFMLVADKVGSFGRRLIPVLYGTGSLLSSAVLVYAVANAGPMDAVDGFDPLRFASMVSSPLYGAFACLGFGCWGVAYSSLGWRRGLTVSAAALLVGGIATAVFAVLPDAVGYVAAAACYVIAGFCGAAMGAPSKPALGDRVGNEQ